MPGGPGQSKAKARRRGLRREAGLWGAVGMGMGSMLGTGVYAGLGLAFAAAGWWAMAAIAAAGALAACNAMASAQLAAAQPVSGGTYAYASRLVSPTAGFAAGWCFLLAKTASAAAAALALVGYGAASGLVPIPGWASGPAAAGVALLVAAFAAGGLRRSLVLNALLVGLALAGLFVFVAAALALEPSQDAAARAAEGAGGPVGPMGILAAIPLAFVAFTGYGRIATLGAEVRDPGRTIPRAIIACVALLVLVYAAVGAAAASVAGPEVFGALARESSAPLAALVAERPALRGAIALGAAAAVGGALLNLVLGLSRVWFAMAEGGDAPKALAEVSPAGAPAKAVLFAGAAIAAACLAGSLEAAWSFSALAVLFYYGLTNWAALRQPASERRFPRWVAAAGLAGCFLLTPAVALPYWIAGGVLLGAGFLLRGALRYRD